jgi:acetyl esterase/lipase
MIKFLVLSLAAAIAMLSAHGTSPQRPKAVPRLLQAGLVDDANPSTDPSEEPCAGVALTRGLKYSENEQNLLDVATLIDKGSTPRPVLLFVAGESFTDEGTSSDWALRAQAICLAARHGMVGVTMAYRRAPAHPWPAGAKDVAAATSWVHQNADLFGGDAKAIIAVGYSVGAFHLASFLAHPEFQEADSNLAGAVLVSGIYRPGDETNDGERSYFGTDASKYDDRSAFPGILEVEAPIVLAWSLVDPPQLISQGEKLKESLCGAGHCPRVAEVSDRDTPASVFDLQGSGKSLAERTQQLISQVEMRGLP